MSYEEFKGRYMAFRTQFSPENFINMSPEDHQVIRVTSFPDQKIDDKKMDALNNDVQFPLRYENYYKSNNSKFLVKLNFIYLPENNTPSFLSINSIKELDNANILEQYQDFNRPLFTEYIISQPGFLVLLNFFDISYDLDEVFDEDFDEYFDKKYKAFVELQKDFYGQFEDILLSLNFENPSRRNHISGTIGSYSGLVTIIASHCQSISEMSSARCPQPLLP